MGLRQAVQVTQCAPLTNHRSRLRRVLQWCCLVRPRQNRQTSPRSRPPPLAVGLPRVQVAGSELPVRPAPSCGEATCEVSRLIPICAARPPTLIATRALRAFGYRSSDAPLPYTEGRGRIGREFHYWCSPSCQSYRFWRPHSCTRSANTYSLALCTTNGTWINLPSLATRTQSGDGTTGPALP